MTVKELIEKLKKFDENLPVYTFDPETEFYTLNDDEVNFIELGEFIVTGGLPCKISKKDYEAYYAVDPDYKLIEDWKPVIVIGYVE